jgi:hypothetical protein
MEINKDNFEAFVLDYFEGNLDSRGREELFSFLNAHPHFRQQFAEFNFEDIRLENEFDVFFPSRNSLKKNLSVSEEQFFNLAEGNLSVEEKIELGKIIAGNPAQEKELYVWQRSRLEADFSVKYPGKESLHRPKVIPLWKNIYLRVAALVVLSPGIAWMYFSPRSSSTQFADKFSMRSDFAVSKEIKTTAVFAIPSTKKKKLKSPSVRGNEIANVSELKKLQDSSLTGVKIKAVLPDSVTKSSIVKTAADSLFKTHTVGVWAPAEKLPMVKKSFRHRMLDLAAGCLKGLKVIGVKKAEAIKKTDPDSGNTAYILVLGNKSYSSSP